MTLCQNPENAFFLHSSKQLVYLRNRHSSILRNRTCLLRVENRKSDVDNVASERGGANVTSGRAQEKDGSTFLIISCPRGGEVGYVRSEIPSNRVVLDFFPSHRFLFFNSCVV
ncbi:hypothetical protein JTE90_018578 [Oedothorax gibbosus]|uniref:Uncharacterized protein n=1 Tax=Oedothorax gibbosus TaxID=931172 RepID=A0AAV6U465_9ARAC|nr:hypothetical protein JTE90_018578 [Oedothorax gibbosus]